MNHTELLTKQEAAERLRISVSSLDRHCKNGLIKPVKVGSRVFFHKNSLPAEITELVPEILSNHPSNPAA